MMNYDAAHNLFQTARFPEKGKPLENNTRLFKRGNDYAIRLHKTDIVTHHSDGTCTLRTGGWYTFTTKDRINKYSTAHVFQDNGLWYVSQNHTYPHRFEKRHIFTDEMKINKYGTPANESIEQIDKQREDVERRKKEVDKLVKDYISGFSRFLTDVGWDECMACEYEEPSIQHLMTHLKGETKEESEGRYPYSLLVDALAQDGYKKPTLMCYDIERDLQRSGKSWHFSSSLPVLLHLDHILLRQDDLVEPQP